MISFLNGRPDAVTLVTNLVNQNVALSVITCGEAFEGLLSTATLPSHIIQFAQFLTTVAVIAPDVDIARRYVGIRSGLRAQGQIIADNDLWIAATALERGLTLVTRDRHFSRVPGLDLYTATP